MANFDVVIEKIGSFGRYQITYWILCGLIIIPAGMQHMGNVFLQATPPFRCSVPDIPNTTDTSAEWGTGEGSCQVYVNTTYTHTKNFSDIEYNDQPISSQDTESFIKCKHWIYDDSEYGVTAVTKWDLVCSRSWLTAAAQSLYMVGVVFGAFMFGHISDISGRKFAICLSLTGVVLFGSLSGLVPWMWAHILLRMVTGVCASGCLTISCVLATELFGIKRRAWPGISEHIFFVIGYLILAGVSHAAKNFQNTALVTGILPVVLLSYWCILPESPRWLLTKGKVSEAKKELSRAAKMNGVSVDVDQIVDECMEMHSTNDTVGDEIKHTALDLFRTPVVRKTSLLIISNWFATECFFYGVSLLYRELIVNIYLNSLVLGALEVAVVILVWLVIDRVGRRLLLASMLVTGGVTLLLSTLIVVRYPVVHTILVTFSRMCVVSTIVVHYTYTSELFPTAIRNIGFGSASTLGHIGAMCAPFINELRFAWGPLPCLLYGVLTITIGLLGLMLPETVHQPLTDTIEQAEMNHIKQTKGTGSDAPETQALLDAASPYPYPGNNRD